MYAFFRKYKIEILSSLIGLVLGAVIALSVATHGAAAAEHVEIIRRL